MVDHVFVVALSFALSLVSLESSFVELSNYITFVRIVHLWEEQHICKMGEILGKMCQISPPVYSSVGSDSVFLSGWGSG